jgi:hypothetical protein
MVEDDGLCVLAHAQMSGAELALGTGTGMDSGGGDAGCGGSAEGLDDGQCD